ncbi:metal-dependent hydrolase [Virgibacillus halodenitrificans]|uniref:metal-dependent hydrolase n=1 Tax=Virgibacillus halodenitrificans TaxID=1482 RepID=UPI000EF47EDF|nr:metal-dependent hydrolase [Virgibacillus halodenitrificans]
MMAATHQTFGITFGLITLILLQLFGFYPSGIVEIIVFFLLVLLGSLLPDLDTPNSKLGRKLWPISFIISRFVKHRTATHSLLFITIVGAIGSFLCSVLDQSQFYAMGLTIGTISHIAGDGLTNTGVPLLYPFMKKRFRTPLTFSTGSLRERGVFYLLIVINVLLFFTVTDVTIPYVQNL